MATNVPFGIPRACWSDPLYILLCVLSDTIVSSGRLFFAIHGAQCTEVICQLLLERLFRHSMRRGIPISDLGQGRDLQREGKVVAPAYSVRNYVLAATLRRKICGIRTQEVPDSIGEGCAAPLSRLSVALTYSPVYAFLVWRIWRAPACTQTLWRV